MRVLLIFTVWFFLARDIFAWDLSYAAGLSAQNAILYLVSMFLFLRMVVGRGANLDARPLLFAWGIVIGYAIFSWLVASLVMKYPGYTLINAGLELKNGLFDHVLFFLVFFLGARTTDDAASVAKAMLFGAVFANAMTVADTSGLIDLGYVEREDGRIQGALGESNQFAAYIILMLPAIVAMMVASRGVRRFAWFCGIMISIVALMMTASRGALVGLLASLAVAAYVYRRSWSVGRLSAWIVGAVLICTVLLIVSQSDQLLAERMLTQTGSIDVSDASSGRTEIWSAALTRMFSAPLTLLTGFGWDVYSSFPFRYAPHNHYLGLWFNLGLVGLVAGSFLLFYSIRLAKRAGDLAPQPVRGLLIGYVIGAIAMCVAIFFVDLHQPWLYFWGYTGVMLRLAANTLKEPVTETQQQPAPRTTPLADAHGWAGRAQTSRLVNR